MKKFRLIFGLLLVAGFVATAVLASTDEDQAIKKEDVANGTIKLPTKG